MVLPSASGQLVSPAPTTGTGGSADHASSASDGLYAVGGPAGSATAAVSVWAKPLSCTMSAYA